jgi:predicted negative regulator of RcsB-dependent stress response
MEGQEALLEWAKRNRQALYWTGGILVFAAAIFGWKILSTRQSEQRASVELSAGRFALESKNYALAASEFARIGANYSGTRSADEATILLAQVRLAQGQSQQAIAVLNDFVGGAGSDYKSQGYALLGAAYENIGHPKEAATAYEEGSRAGRLPFLRAQLLSDAGRAWLAAHDTSKAIAAYHQIITKFDSTASAYEAKARLGELGEVSSAAKQ